MFQSQGSADRVQAQGPALRNSLWETVYLSEHACGVACQPPSASHQGPTACRRALALYRAGCLWNRDKEINFAHFHPGAAHSLSDAYLSLRSLPGYASAAVHTLEYFPGVEQTQPKLVALAISCRQ